MNQNLKAYYGIDVDIKGGTLHN